MALYKSNFPDGFSSNSTPAVISIVGVKIETFTLSGTDISNGYIDLLSTPDQVSTVAIDWNGIDQYLTTDYTIFSNRITFSAPLLANLDVGDLIKISYQ